MPNPIQSGYYHVSPPVDETNPYIIEELEAFERKWLANGAAELQKAHYSEIAGHLLTLSLYRLGSPELFQSIEQVLLQNNQAKLKECDFVSLKWIISAFGERELGSTAFYQAMQDRLLENDAAFIRQYTTDSLSDITRIFMAIPIDNSKLFDMIDRAWNEQIQLYGR